MTLHKQPEFSEQRLRICLKDHTIVPKRSEHRYFSMQRTIALDMRKDWDVTCVQQRIEAVSDHLFRRSLRKIDQHIPRSIHRAAHALAQPCRTFRPVSELISQVQRQIGIFFFRVV